MSSPSIVYVLLGENPAPTLYHFALKAQVLSPKSEVILITDHPASHYKFPGTVINYVRDTESRSLALLYRKFRERIELSGGYWMYTLERLFALTQLSKCEINGPIIHLESDVLLSTTPEHVEKLGQMCKKTSIPRYSSDMGIASFLYSPSIHQLISDLNSLSTILFEHMSLNRNFLTDMQLLGHGLNTSLLQELPTLPNDAWILDNDERGRKLVFDGLAYGQYLFGQDPLHQEGMRISGHQNEYFREEIKNFRWSVRPQDHLLFTVGYEWAQSQIEIANIHVHSKELVENPSIESLRWQRAIDEANGLCVRAISGPFPDIIHSRKVKFSTQLRLSRQNGKIANLLNVIKHFRAKKRMRP